MKFKIQLTKQQQNILVVSVVLLGVGGFFYVKYLWVPVSERIEAANKKIEEIERKIERAKSQAARLPRIQHELEVLNQQAAEVAQRLPKDKDVPAVIDTVNRIASRYGILINNFAPGGVSAKQYFSEVPYTMNVTGTYNNIGRFFAAIALEERIFNIRNVIYAVSGSPTSGEQPLSVNFTLISYQYKG